MTPDSLSLVLSTLRTDPDSAMPDAQRQDRVDMYLRFLGDALRFDVQFPIELLEWLKSCSKQEYETSVRRVFDSSSRHVLPPKGAEPDERLELTVNAVDQAKSVIVALRRLHGPDVWNLNGFDELHYVALETHRLLFEEYSSDLLHRCLGDRQTMVDPFVSKPLDETADDLLLMMLELEMQEDLGI